ncbi:MAG: hypothetical protein MUF84_08690 [Anaerolineae bacterium]|jgi:hypothetical protein|nr:hypothetical protein [Anaerolineae bacterium]
MRHSAALLLALSILLLSACKADVCPPGSVSYVAEPSLFPNLASSTEADPGPTPSLIQIGRKTIEVDRVIHGPLCNDTWSGTVYVACDVQVVEWTKDEGSKFLDGCNLTIEPETVVYVAAHNNAPYYKGCASCHQTKEATAIP